MMLTLFHMLQFTYGG